MYAPCFRCPGLGIIFDESVEEGRVAFVGDAVHIPTGLGGVLGVEGGELGGFAARDCEDALGLFEWASHLDCGSAYGRYFPTHELSAGAVSVVAYVI